MKNTSSASTAPRGGVRRLGAVALLGGLLLLSACHPAPAQDPVATASATKIAATPTPASSCLLSCGDVPQAQFTGPAEIVWDQASKNAAATTAHQAMVLFARPSLTADTWANDLAQLLTPQAVSAFYGTDPALIPAHKVTGPAVMSFEAGNGFAATATVPTDAGKYQLQLLRNDASSPFKVNRITPVEGQ